MRTQRPSSGLRPGTQNDEACVRVALEVVSLAVWMVMWAAGGILITARGFRLGRAETGLVGLGVGLVLQVWLAGILARIAPIPLAFWLSAAFVLATGVQLTIAGPPFRWPTLRVGQWVLVAALTLLFFAIGRGLAIFDDYQNLPTVSIMAAGDVPPHFALDPALRFGYHHFLLLFAAELMVLGRLLPWSALDLARGVLLALPLALATLWVRRLTRNILLAFLGMLTVALAGGARWLLLLLPRSWLAGISSNITLIGSAASSASNLAEALVSPWKIDGAGPIDFPFAFYSGIHQPYVMLHTGIAGSGVLILLLLLLTSQRWTNRGGALITTALMAALAIANEIAFLLVGLGLLIVGGAWLVNRRHRRGGAALRQWFMVAGAALLIAFVQGGLLTELVLAAANPGTAPGGYFDTAPTFSWPPALVSAHLGSLSLLNPAQTTAALLEIGPIVAVSPLLVVWWLRCMRRGKWFEAALIASSLGAIIAMFVSFPGPLYTASPRLLGGWLLVSALYFVPLWWSWSSRKGEWAQIGGITVGLLSCLGGVILLGVQFAAIQRPVYATFINQLDAKMSAEHWNELGQDALVFDPIVFRAPTVFGRPTRSSPTWYTRSEEWDQLREGASPAAIRQAGFTHIYMDSDYWDELTPAQRQAFEGACIVVLWQVDGARSETDYRKDFRRLLDIQACE
jgi:hypothetical protein